MEKRNIIVLGLSQHGKSTFLNDLVQFQGGHQSASVGDGTSRCTSMPEVYEIFSPGEPTYILGCAPLPTTSPKDSQSEHTAEASDEVRRNYWKTLKKADDYDPLTHKLEPVELGRNLVSGQNLGMRWLSNAAALMVFGNPAARVVADVREVNRLLDAVAGASAEQSPIGMPIQISALDTPGLDDSKGEDDAHIEHVITKVLEMKTLSGLVMVSKCGCPITPAWQAQVLRYWNLFPMLRSQWIFVHTKADPMAIGAKERRTTSSFESMATERSRFVNDTLAVLTGDKDFQAAHLFVESDYEEYPALKAYLAEQQNMLFTLIANFSPVSIDDLPFEKGPTLLAIDRSLISALDSTINAFVAAITEVHKDIGMLMQLRTAQAEERKGLDSSISKLQLQLQDVDHDGDLDLVQYVQCPWYWFSHPTAKVDFVTQHAKYKVTVTDMSGYNRTYLQKEYVNQTELPDTDGLKKLEVGLKVPHVFTRLSGKIVVSSKSRDVYAEKISILKKQLASEQGLLKVMVGTHEAAQMNLGVKNEVAKVTELREKTARAMKTFLSTPWPLSTWKVIQPFYEEYKKIGGMEAHVMLRKFQHQWQKYIEETGLDVGFEITDIADR